MTCIFWLDLDGVKLNRLAKCLGHLAQKLLCRLTHTHTHLPDCNVLWSVVLCSGTKLLRLLLRSPLSTGRSSCTGSAFALSVSSSSLSVLVLLPFLKLHRGWVCSSQRENLNIIGAHFYMLDVLCVVPQTVSVQRMLACLVTHCRFGFI